MKTYKKNFDLLKKNNVYSEDMEHDACGVGLIASTCALQACTLKF